MTPDQGDLFCGKPRARPSDPETSHVAADGISPDDLRQSQVQVLLLFREEGPFTDERLVELCRERGVKQSPSGLRTRRSELVDKGLLEDSGDRQETMFGNPAIVWRTTKGGRFLAADIQSRRERGE